VIETLKKVAEEGFSEDAVAASMNTIEFDVSETCVYFAYLAFSDLFSDEYLLR
jgi:hypothetical protein